MHADGTGQHRLTKNAAFDGLSTWSPDGERIAFVSERDQNDEIYVMDADGTNVHRLTNSDARDALPTWQP